jgi:hypothetical protein
MRVVVALVGVVLVAVTMRIGWQLPEAESCEGDSCVSTSWFAIDWDRVTWQVSPTRIACFDPNPPRTAVLLHPGDVCVRSSGDGSVELRRTYAQLRSDFAHRRVLTLALAAAILALTTASVLWTRTRACRTSTAG